jgi:Flp pilus assembly protein protease CpaA
MVGGLRGLGGAVGGCALLALPYVLLFLFGKGGAGDAKLMGAIGAWVGLTDGVIVLVCVAIAGAVLAIANMVARGRLTFVLINAICWLCALVGYMIRYVMRRKPNESESYASQYAYAHRLTGLSIPYGVAIFVGVCVAGGYVLLCK